MSPAAEILGELAVAIYEQPLFLRMRESGSIADVSNPACVVMLLLDFETEVPMNGIADFIGNSTGRYASETVAAFEGVGCGEAAQKLREILAVAEKAGMTHESIQGERQPVGLFAVTSFAELHGGKWNAAHHAIRSICESIDMPDVFEATQQFVAAHSTTFDAVLANARS